MLATAGTKLTVSVLRSLDPDPRCAKVGNMAQKRHGALPVPIFHFPVRGTHSTKRLNLASGALGYSRPLVRAQSHQRLFPHLLYPSLTNIECFLLGDHANTNLTKSIYGKRGHTTAAKVDGVDQRKAGRIFQITLGQTS